MIVVWRANDL